MGFFGDLKQDLSQAVNELLPEEEAAMQEEAPAESQEPSVDDFDLEKMLEDALAGDVSADGENTPVDNTEADSEIDDILDGMEAEAVQEEIIVEKTEEVVVEEPEPKVKEKHLGGFDRKMDSNFDRQISDETSVITPGMTVNGDISSEGSVEILGKVKGNIDVAGKLNITGNVEGNSKAHEIFAENAHINGDVVSESSIKIGAGTVIVGNISGFSAAVAGAVKGDIDVHGPVILDSSAIVMGNIRSKSVQINNGAAIEGMCSQCYADVSPTSFFDDYKDEPKKNK